LPILNRQNPIPFLWRGRGFFFAKRRQRQKLFDPLLLMSQNEFLDVHIDFWRFRQKK